MAAAGATGQRREAARWWQGFWGAAALCAIVFAIGAQLSPVAPSSAWGLAYGATAALLLAGAALYGVRRRAMAAASRWHLGRSRTWLYFHIYGGSLFLLLVLMHTGFRTPDGALAWLLFGGSLWTVASGAIGLALQQWLPRAIGSALATEIHYDRIPELAEELRNRAAALAASCGEPIQMLYARRVQPEMGRPRRSWLFFADITGSVQRRLREFEFLRDFLAEPEAEKLAELERLYRTKLELDAHFTLQWALRGWLWIHVPPALALVAIVAIHIGTVAYY